MRLIALASALAIALALAACGGRTEVERREAPDGAIAWSGVEQDAKGEVSFRFGLRTVRRGGADRHFVDVEAWSRREKGPVQWGAARLDTGADLDFMPGPRRGGPLDVTETFSIGLPQGLVEERKERGFGLRLASRSGREQVLILTPDMIQAQVRAVGR